MIGMIQFILQLQSPVDDLGLTPTLNTKDCCMVVCMYVDGDA